MTRHASDPQSAAQRAGEEFDELFRASERRADEKRRARSYPYDLDERP